LTALYERASDTFDNPINIYEALYWNNTELLYIYIHVHIQKRTYIYIYKYMYLYIHMLAYFSCNNSSQEELGQQLQIK